MTQPRQTAPRRHAPRLVATDLDGTLLRSDSTVSPRTISALRGAEAAGASVVLVTGRPPRSMRPIAQAVGHTGLAICANGAVLYDLRREVVLDAWAFEPGIVRSVAAAVRAAVPGVAFAVETTNGFAHEPAYPTHPLDRRSDPTVGEITELVDTAPVVKLLVRNDAWTPDRLLAAARDVAGDLAEFTHSSRIGLLEVSAVGITKASGLASVAAERGIDAADVMAFGDMPNDLPMLAWAGRAYAMENAHAEVKAAVSLHAPANDDDGVARVLEEAFGLVPDRS